VFVSSASPLVTDCANPWFWAFRQNDLIDKLSKQASNATHYIVFDPCRNELNQSGPRKGGNKSGERRGMQWGRPVAAHLV
jgi:hypothetical protein